MVNYTEEDMDTLFKEGLKSLPVNYSVKNWEFLEQQLNEHNTKIKYKNKYKKSFAYVIGALVVLSLGYYWLNHKKNNQQKPSEVKTVLIDSIVTKALSDSVSIKSIDKKTDLIEPNSSFVKSKGAKNITKTETTDSVVVPQIDELKKDSSKFIFW